MGEQHVHYDNGKVGQIDGQQVPRFAGLTTFGRLPRRDEVADFDIAVVGVPFDSGVSYRPGARFGPSYIREASRLLRPYNPALDVLPFVRAQVVDAGDIAWHTRQLSRIIEHRKPEDATRAIVRARISPVGEGMQVLVYTPDQPDLFARICGYFDQAGFSILDAKVHTASDGRALDTFQVVTAALPEHYRELISMVETNLARTIDQAGPLPAPSRGRVSRRVKSFPIAPRIDLRPDDKAQRWLLSISASDRVGLLYSVARVLAKHKINLRLAKVTTLGERVEDTFLIDGPELQQNWAQIEIETELLQALAA